jgi:hypothetical protein
MRVSPVGDKRAGRVSTRSDDRATQLTAQICAGIVTNRATEYLHPEAEVPNMSATVTKTVVRELPAGKRGFSFSVPSRG